MAQSKLRRADPNSVRKWNEFLVVAALEAGPQRISTLARNTGLTPAPLGEVLRGLESKGWVDSTRSNAGGPGRPAQVYSLLVPPGSVLGLDVGAHAVRCTRLDLSGNVCGRSERRVHPGQIAERNDAIAGVVRDVLADDGHPVWLTGLAVTGTIDPDGLVLNSIALPDLIGEHPSRLWADLVPGRTFVTNDVRALGLAEHRQGAARGHRDVLFVQLGRRPSLGLMFDGRPRSGAHGAAGDMSQNKLFPTESEMGWVGRFRDSEDPIGDAVRAAVAGDEEVLRGVHEYVEKLTPSLASTTGLVDPSIVVVGGALTPIAPHFIDDLAAAMGVNVHEPPLVRVSELDQYGTSLGAALAALQRLKGSLADATNGVQPFDLTTFADLPLALDPTASSRAA